MTLPSRAVWMGRVPPQRRGTLSERTSSDTGAKASGFTQTATAAAGLQPRMCDPEPLLPLERACRSGLFFGTTKYQSNDLIDLNTAGERIKWVHVNGSAVSVVIREGRR